ncbi:NUDIX hydrolase [Psychrobacter urativorans]|uniref:DNA mismatch repair protein MutT n=1 Tax=Psychrobacter urativorans TaxID=45610 RepID=A0A0M5MK17_9GAMM|nr:CoA pyrophosphatase [Psychrobacter urativorans]ALF59442.1 DNA mismatch repair protein MutT [Psychrobacter urativorans]
MAVSWRSSPFDELAVALPAYIRQPILRQLAERMQGELLGTAIPSLLPFDVTNANDTIAQSTLILNKLYQTPIADASILVAITNESRPKLLLTRRAIHMNSHAGEVSCAGGKYENGDGNNVVTALREACEEIALPPNKVQLLGQLPIQMSKSGMSVRPIVALIAPDLILVPELSEISRIFWADFETLITQPTVEYSVRYTMQAQTSTLLTPSWQIDGEIVWGLTGRVLASLLETGFDRQLEWYYRIQNMQL